MKRTQSNISTRDKILREAEKLILLQGFNGTSIDSVCERAGVTKGGFFHHFTSKEDLAIFILRKYWLETLTLLSQSRHLRSRDPLKRLLGSITFFEELFELPKRPTACLIGNITQEVALTNSIVKAACEKIFAEWTQSLETSIGQIAENSQVSSKKLDKRGLAEMVISTIEGAFILVKATDDVKASRRALAHLKNYLRLVLS